MALFGRNTARQRLRRAARDSLTVPAFSVPIDCTPWVTGGLWPVELSAMTAQTALPIRHLKADLQRIVDAANEKLDVSRRTETDQASRQAAEARIINDARAFARTRVDSAVRAIRDAHGQSSGGQHRMFVGDEIAN